MSNRTYYKYENDQFIDNTDNLLSDGVELSSYLATAIAEGFCEGEGYTDIMDQLKAWSYIGKNKLYLHLQGFFGRRLRDLVEQGLLKEDFNIPSDILEILEQLKEKNNE